MRPPRLLLLSLYYPPDLSACSFRSAALVKALCARDPSLEIDVVTSLPNRYHSFTIEAPEREVHGGVTVHRIALPTHRSGMVDQARAFARFAAAASRLARARDYDLVYATSSRLMTASLGARIASRMGAPLYLDIRDIFVETIGDVLGDARAVVLSPMLSQLERWTIRRATRVNLVSRGFASWFDSRYPDRQFSYHTNGVDDEFAQPVAAPTRPAGAVADRLRIVYAGNMGEGQGLHRIMPELARRLGPSAEFRLIGDGGRRTDLANALAAAGVQNVTLVPPMSRAALRAEYANASALFLHLNDLDAFKRVLPSKIFEYAATGQPILAGVAGYAAEFLRTEVKNAAVFAPCDAEGAVQAVRSLEMGVRSRAPFVERFRRTRIMDAMAADVLATLSLSTGPRQ